MERELYFYECEIVRVVDGDSIVLSVDLGFRMSFKDNFRLRGINCPEMNMVEGVAAKQALTDKLATGKHFDVYSEKHGKYRWLADLYMYQQEYDDPVHINEWLIEAGFAERYL